MMSDMYDPTEEFDDPSPTFEVGRRKVDLPSETNGFELVRTGPEGRPTYRAGHRASPTEVWVARDWSTDVIHRRYRVVVDDEESQRTIADGLSPEEMMEFIREVIEDRVADDAPREYTDDRMENAHYWAAQLLGWMKEGPHAGIRGTYYVDIIGGKPVLVMDDSWSEEKVEAIEHAMRDHFPQPYSVKELDDEWRLFIREPTDERLVSDWHPNWRAFQPTGGDGGDPAAMFATDQLEWETPSPVQVDDPEPTPDEPDVSDQLYGLGINRVSANHLADEYGSVEAIKDAARDADAITDLKGVGEASAAEVLDSLDLEPVEVDDPEPAACPASDRAADEMALSRVEGIGPTRADRLLDAFGDLRTISRKAASTTTEIADIEGFSQDTADDLFDRMREARVFVSGASGTGRPLAEIHEEFCPTIEKQEREDAVETATETPAEKELDWPALTALKKAWAGYRHAIGEGHAAAEAVEEYREKHREAALEYAAIINDIRAAHGQDPIDFEGVPGIPAVDSVAGQITEGHPDVELSFNWRADSYDLIDELA